MLEKASFAIVSNSTQQTQNPQTLAFMADWWYGLFLLSVK